MSVRVEPVRVEWIEALATSDEAFSAQFAIPVTPDWIGFPDALAYMLDAARSSDRDPWGSHLFFDDDDDGALVGVGGFKGRPVEGTVEIGYAVAPSRQGRGLATGAAAAMIEQARNAGVDAVVAHTLAEEGPSTAVLAHCGFTRVGSVADPDGSVEDEVWRWELRLR